MAHEIWKAERKMQSATSIALRKSEVAQLQLCSFETLSLVQPSIALSLSKIFTTDARSSGCNTGKQDIDARRHIIAILPMSDEVPVKQFAKQLMEATTATG